MTVSLGPALAFSFDINCIVIYDAIYKYLPEVSTNKTWW